MARYCVESDLTASRFILHLQRCESYNHTQLLVLDRLCDIGDCLDADDALRKARRDFSVVHPCGRCLEMNRAVRAA